MELERLILLTYDVPNKHTLQKCNFFFIRKFKIFQKKYFNSEKYLFLLYFIVVTSSSSQCYKCKWLQYSNSPNSEQIAASQGFDFTSVPKGGTHHNSLIVKLLVVVVDLSHTFYTYKYNQFHIILVNAQQKIHNWVLSITYRFNTLHQQIS